MRCWRKSNLMSFSTSQVRLPPRPDLALVLPTFHSLLTSTVNILSATASLGCRRLVISRVAHRTVAWRFGSDPRLSVRGCQMDGNGLHADVP